MVELCEALVVEQWRQKGSPAALDDYQMDGCFLLAPFGFEATPVAEVSPGTFLRAPQAWVGERYGPLYTETVPAVSGSSY